MNVNTEDGKGIFNSGKLTLWRYNGYSFPNGITFHLSYKRNDFTEGLQAIFMSCDENNHKANLGIMLNATSTAEDKVHIFVRPNRRYTELAFVSKVCIYIRKCLCCTYIYIKMCFKELRITD